MKKCVKRLVALFLVAFMCVNMLATSVYAEQTDGSNDETVKSNIWHGDKVSVDVKKGENEYTFMSVYPSRAYEMSNHMVSIDGGVNNDIPQTLLMVEANRDYTWSAKAPYVFGADVEDDHKYEVLYCCDAETGYENQIYYKRTNLEDSSYYDEEKAAHIRAIITNSYPYVSLDHMKASLKNEGFEDADKLTRAEIITAVQAVIWAYANNITDYKYSQTFDVTTNPQWGEVFHDYTNEMQPIWWTIGKRKFTTNEEVGARINSLIEHLKKQEKVYAEKNQIVISDIKVVNSAPVIDEDGMYTVDIKVLLNNSGSSNEDNIIVTVYVDDEEYTTREIEYGTEEYDLSVKAGAGQTIKAVVSGKQMLPKGVYFYDPEGGRDVSQSLVGVAAGETDVYAEAIAPRVTGYLGEFSFNKIDSFTKEPMEGVEFVLEHDGEDCAGCHGDVIVGNYVKGSKDYDKYIVKSTSDVSGNVKFENIPSGHTYTLKENTPNGYEANNNWSKKVEVSFDKVLIDGAEAEEFTLENTPNVITVEGKKVWKDYNNAYRLRPESIDLKLYQSIDGKKTEVVGAIPEWSKPEGSNTWEWKYNDLPEAINGKVVTYSVREVNVPYRYIMGQDGNTITNTFYIPPVITPTPTPSPTPTHTPEPTDPEVTPTPEVPVDPSEGPMDPTLEPDDPTSDPTIDPSVDPTIAPTEEIVDPTIDPTITPSNDPTVVPTEVPVITPSKAPLSPTANVEVEKDKYQSNKNDKDNIDKEDKTPTTSDTNNMDVYIMMMILSAYMFICMIVVRRTKSVNN